MTSPLSCVEIPATSNPKYSVIWLHGLGADGHDFESIVPELRLNNAAHINFIFPNAPVQAVTINGGMQCVPGMTYSKHHWTERSPWMIFINRLHYWIKLFNNKSTKALKQKTFCWQVFPGRRYCFAYRLTLSTKTSRYHGLIHLYANYRAA